MLKLTLNKRELKKQIRVLSRLDKMITSSVRQALKRGIGKARTETDKTIRLERKIKQSELFAKFLKIELRVGGEDINTMSAILHIRGRALTLTRFVIGSKTNLKRKRITREITPKRKKRMGKNAFLQKMPSGKILVVRVSGKGKQAKLIAQTTPALGTIYSREKIHTPIENIVAKSYVKELDRILTVKLNKLKV